MSGDYSGQDRRGNGGPLGDLTREMRAGFAGVNESLERQNVALFAKDAENEFGTAGVMTILQKVDAHITLMCTWAKAIRKALKFGFWLAGGVGTVAGAMAAARAAGWM